MSAQNNFAAGVVAFDTLRAANLARQQEWDPGDKLSLAYRLNELAGETGEACNVGKKLERERLGIRGSRDTVEHLAEELADVVICADLVAMSEGIDLDTAVAAKFNATSEKVGLSTRLAVRPGNVAFGRALADIAAERTRQAEVETFDASHDDMATRGQLAAAAACYALNGVEHWAKDQGIKEFWPWAVTWWKPKDRRLDLVKAAALIVAEIERLDRLSTRVTS